MTRRKSYKNMSVTELVKERKGLVEKIIQIDKILGEAAKAVNSVYQPVNNQEYNTGVIPVASNDIQQVSVSSDAPQMQPVTRNSPDQSSGFTLFDTESYVRQQHEAANKYLEENPNTPPEFNFNEVNVKEEIEHLAKEVKEGLKNVESPSAI